MRSNHVRQRLASGEASIGTWVSLPSPEAVEFIATLGFDWIVVDAEHNTIDVRTMGQMFAAVRHTPIAPMVRIPWNNPEHVKRALDAGAWGIVFPMVKTREEAEMAVRACKFPPEGDRSVGGSRHAMSFAGSNADYYERANDEILVVVQIEHIEGVENADAILSVPGVDACFIGPNDLAASMNLGVGVPLEWDHPELVDAINRIREACDRNGVAPGIHTSGAAGVNQRLAEGFRMMAMASELKYMLGGLSADLAKLNWSRAGVDGQATQPTAQKVQY